MGKIVRLTETKLKTIIAGIIKEQMSAQTVQRTHANSQLVDKVFANIKGAMSGPGTDEDAIFSALSKFAPNTTGAGWDANVAQKRKDYEYLMQLIRKEGFNSIMEWIKTELSDVAKHDDPLGLTKFTHGNDLKVLQGAQKLEDLLSGKNNYM